MEQQNTTTKDEDQSGNDANTYLKKRTLREVFEKRKEAFEKQKEAVEKLREAYEKQTEAYLTLTLTLTLKFINQILVLVSDEANDVSNSFYRYCDDGFYRYCEESE
jgi:hypothetical protein